MRCIKILCGAPYSILNDSKTVISGWWWGDVIWGTAVTKIYVC